MTVPSVIILAGGRGTRLPESARDIPKVLVPVAGEPILQHQLERLQAAGFSTVRLALGFRADQIMAFLRARGHSCDAVVEPEPLGTGGAARFAAADLPGPYLIMSGDIMADFDFRAIARSHQPGEALMVAHWQHDARDYGLLDVRDGRVVGFREKPQEPIAGFINAGCCMLEAEHLAALPEGFSMLEHDLYPSLAGAGRIRMHEHRGEWEDLGTEARLARIRERLTAS